MQIEKSSDLISPMLLTADHSDTHRLSDVHCTLSGNGDQNFGNYNLTAINGLHFRSLMGKQNAFKARNCGLKKVEVHLPSITVKQVVERESLSLKCSTHRTLSSVGASRWILGQTE